MKFILAKIKNHSFFRDANQQEDPDSAKNKTAQDKHGQTDTILQWKHLDCFIIYNTEQQPLQYKPNQSYTIRHQRASF